eukprot:UN00107
MISKKSVILLRLLLAINRDDRRTFSTNILLRITTLGLRRQSGTKNCMSGRFRSDQNVISRPERTFGSF